MWQCFECEQVVWPEHGWMHWGCVGVNVPEPEQRLCVLDELGNYWRVRCAACYARRLRWENREIRLRLRTALAHLNNALRLIQDAVHLVAVSLEEEVE